MLTQDTSLGDQPAAMSDGVEERLEDPLGGGTAAALAGERDQGGAVAVVVFEAA